LTNTCGGAVTATSGTNFISLSGGSIPAAGSCTIVVNARGLAVGLQTNFTGNVTSSDSDPGNSATASITIGDVYEVSYAPNLNLGDAVINISNPGTIGGGFLSGTTAATLGAISVDVYAFSPYEQLFLCFSCPVTPNGLVSLSDRADILSNTLTPATPNSFVVKLLASVPIGASCINAAAAPGALAPSLVAWGTTLHVIAPVGAAVTETAFTPATLSTSELARMTSFCGFIQANGSGFGICKSCRLGGLGSDKQ
jgi:hypothetical protein